jgi:hypothetical protein
MVMKTKVMKLTALFSIKSNYLSKKRGASWTKFWIYYTRIASMFRFFSSLYFVLFFLFLSHSIYFYFFESESYLKKMNQSNTTYLNILSHASYHEKMYSICTYFAEVYMSVLFLSPTVITLNVVYFSICQCMYIM